MFSLKNIFLLDKNRFSIFKKYKIYVDVSIDENNNFEVSQKLTSFFSQVVVCEGHDRIINYIGGLFKINSINFFYYKEGLDFHNSDLEKFSNEETIFDFEEFDKNEKISGLRIYIEKIDN